MSSPVSIVNQPLTFRVIENATSSQFRYDRETRRMQGCLYDQSGNRIDAGIRIGGHGGDVIINNDPAERAETERPKRSLAGTSIYLGNLMSQFGHFITEGLSTFWALDYCKVDHFVFHPFLFGDDVKPFMIPIHLAFGVTEDRVVILREPCHYERIIVPDRTLILNFNAHVEHRRTIRNAAMRIGGLAAKPSRKVFVSRTRLAEDRRPVPNGTELDQLASDCGYEVIHPQELDVVQQVSLYRRTRVLAGASGSALHNCLFQQSGAKLVEIGTPRLPHAPHPMQVICNMLAEVEARHVSFDTSHGLFDLKAIEVALRDAAQPD